jgi:hypothetical protein
MEALTNREGKQANTIAEKEKILRGESFPLNDGDQHYIQPPADQAHQLKSEKLVEHALLSQSVRKAPGLDTSSLGVTKLLWKLKRMRNIGLRKVAVQAGCHPTL